MDDFTHYEAMRDGGATPREVYLAAKQHHADEIMAIRLLRKVFGLSLVEAKQATVGEPLADHQAKLAPALGRALEDLTQESRPKK